MENTATIDVNGRRYDAQTGVVIGPSSAPAVRNGGRNIDGFFRSRITATPRIVTPPPAGDNGASAIIPLRTAPTIRDIAGKSQIPKPKHVSATRVINHAKAHKPQLAESRVITIHHPATYSQTLEVHRGKPNHIQAHNRQHSRTLRRDIVPAPMVSTHKTLSPQAALQHKMPTAIALKTAVTDVNPDRLARAYSTPRSPFIARHAKTLHSSMPTPAFAPMAVQPMPLPGEPPVPGTGSAPVAPPPQPTNKPTDIFEHAVANASNYVDMKAHTAVYKKHARMHFASMTVGVLVLVIAGSFVAYRTNPGLQLKVASFRSGVSSTLPDLTGSGFAYDGATVNGNRLVFGLTGRGSNYQLAQTTTNMSDAELIETIGSTYASGTPQYDTVMVGNTMVYRFSNTTATWISNGKWYSLSGTSALSNQQVQKIVQHI